MTNRPWRRPAAVQEALPREPNTAFRLAAARFVLEIDIGKRLSAVVADDKAGRRTGSGG